MPLSPTPSPSDPQRQQRRFCGRPPLSRALPVRWYSCRPHVDERFLLPYLRRRHRPRVGDRPSRVRPAQPFAFSVRCRTRPACEERCWRGEAPSLAYSADSAGVAMQVSLTRCTGRPGGGEGHRRGAGARGDVAGPLVRLGTDHVLTLDTAAPARPPTCRRPGRLTAQGKAAGPSRPGDPERGESRGLDRDH